MSLSFVPQPPGGEHREVSFGAPSHSPTMRPKSAPNTGRQSWIDKQASNSSIREILKTVTPNYVVTAVIKNRLEEGRLRAQKKKRKTRQMVLAAMDLRELQASQAASFMERLAMARMGFLDKAREVEEYIESERRSMQKQREQKEQAILAQKLAGLDVMHRRRMVGLETELAAELRGSWARAEKERADLRAKHRRQYNMLIEETAQRAYGGVSHCQASGVCCQKPYLCRHNKTASYNTRKPTRDVIRLRQNAERLRATGRIEEAEEFERQVS
ncbi:unnamed protein product, partial [Phaeothamnion confervicola]